jgi:hypothetical protein
MNINDIQKFKRTTFHNRTIYIVILLTIIFELIILSGCRESLTEKSDEFAVAPNLYYESKFKVYHPYDGFEIEPGKTLTIKWQTNKEIIWVDIFLYRKSAQELSIAVRKNNSNEYAWIIPNWFHWSHHYSIKIQNHYDDKEFGFSDTFSIIVRSVFPYED